MEGYQVFVVYGAFGLYLLLLCVASITDIMSFKIPNEVCAALFLLFFPVALMVPAEIDWLSHIGAAVLVFACGIVLYIFRWFGAGDVKLMAAVAVWAGFGHLLAFLFYVSLGGGVLGLVLLTLRFIAPRLPRPQTADGTAELPKLLTAGERIPYGVAIAAGSIFLGFTLPIFKI